jgi:hypothetical protein
MLSLFILNVSNDYIRIKSIYMLVIFILSICTCYFIPKIFIQNISNVSTYSVTLSKYLC